MKAFLTPGNKKACLTSSNTDLSFYIMIGYNTSISCETNFYVVDYRFVIPASEPESRDWGIRLIYEGRLFFLIRNK